MKSLGQHLTFAIVGVCASAAFEHLVLNTLHWWVPLMGGMIGIVIHFAIKGALYEFLPRQPLNETEAKYLISLERLKRQHKPDYENLTGMAVIVGFFVVLPIIAIVAYVIIELAK